MAGPVQEERQQHYHWEEANFWRSTLDILGAFSTPNRLQLTRPATVDRKRLASSLGRLPPAALEHSFCIRGPGITSLRLFRHAEPFK